MMIRKMFLAVLILGLIGIFPASAPADEFYEGKTVRFIVGYRAGGGYDVYTRLIAHHMNRHIPGNPSLIVENMPGAGSLIAANHIFNRAKPDGLTIGVFASGLVREEALGNPKVQFSAEKFDWIGAPTAAAPSCAIMGFTGLKTWDDVRNSKKELHFGSTGPGATTHDVTLLIKELAGAPVKLVAGYGGTSDVRAALQRRELDGACWTWESMKATAREMLDTQGDDRLIPFLLEGKDEDPSARTTMQFTEVIKGEENLSVFRGYLNALKFFRPLALPPNTPRERVTTLRTAFRKTLEDPQFVGAAEKAKLEIMHISGEEIEKLVDEIHSMSPRARERLKALLAG